MKLIITKSGKAIETNSIKFNFGEPILQEIDLDEYNEDDQKKIFQNPTLTKTIKKSIIKTDEQTP